ncbi:MAG: hypothetical protein ACOYXT_04355, partial [Bacteroidota bacterium]
MNFSVQNTERRCRSCVGTMAILIKEPIVKQIMRISVVLLALLFTSLQLLLATTPGRGQGTEDTKLTL